MEVTPLLIVLLSAAGHALWNLLAKQSRHKLVFIWGLYSLALPLFLPIYLWKGLGADFSAEAWACMVASGAVKAIYVIRPTRSAARRPPSCRCGRCCFLGSG